MEKAKGLTRFDRIRLIITVSTGFLVLLLAGIHRALHGTSYYEGCLLMIPEIALYFCLFLIMVLQPFFILYYLIRLRFLSALVSAGHMVLCFVLIGLAMVIDPYTLVFSV